MLFIQGSYRRRILTNLHNFIFWKVFIYQHTFFRGICHITLSVMFSNGLFSGSLIMSIWHFSRSAPAWQLFSFLKHVINSSSDPSNARFRAQDFIDFFIISGVIKDQAAIIHTIISRLSAAFKLPAFVSLFIPVVDIHPFVVLFRAMSFKGLVPRNIRCLNVLCAPSRYNNLINLVCIEKCF